MHNKRCIINCRQQAVFRIIADAEGGDLYRHLNIESRNHNRRAIGTIRRACQIKSHLRRRCIVIQILDLQANAVILIKGMRKNRRVYSATKVKNFKYCAHKLLFAKLARAVADIGSLFYFFSLVS